MKLRINVVLCLDNGEDAAARRRFRKAKKHAKRLGHEGLGVLVLNALERDLARDEKTIGFRAR